MSIAGVVATHGGHPAGVCSDVARPRLGDVQGPVGVEPQAGGRGHVNRRAALLPHVPGGVHIRMRERHTHTHTLFCISECCDSKSVCLRQFIQKNTEGADTDEKPCEADGKGI